MEVKFRASAARTPKGGHPNPNPLPGRRDNCNALAGPGVGREESHGRTRLDRSSIPGAMLDDVFLPSNARPIRAFMKSKTWKEIASKRVIFRGIFPLTGCSGCCYFARVPSGGVFQVSNM